MDARQLKDAMARYLATVNADDPDEWYATDREIYSEVLERFAQWLETADQPAACICDHIGGGAYVKDPRCKDPMHHDHEWTDHAYCLVCGVRYDSTPDQQSSRRGFDFKCGCGADNWNRYECGVCGKDPHKPADQQAVSMQDAPQPTDGTGKQSMQACTTEKQALVQPEMDDDPTPWCSYCGARTKERCNCGPIADNE
jgi:hypothetical protein